MPSVPAGVRAAGHDAEACPRPPEVLPPLLRQRMGRARPRGTPAPGALRLRVTSQRERLSRRRRHGGGSPHHHVQRKKPCDTGHPGGRMDTSAPALPRQKAPVPDASGRTMTAKAVPITSCRGCPSMAAGTIFRPLATALASSALTSTNWCRTDTSGDVRHTTRPALPSASAPSYSSSTQHPGEHRLEGHRTMFHNRPSPFLLLPVATVLIVKRN